MRAMRVKVGSYTANVTIDPERRELVGAVRLGRDGFSFRGRSFAELERECARSARILERARRASRAR
jgi:predicted HicB family RNase H-like nuclease